MTRIMLYFGAVSANLGVLSSGLFFGWLSPALSNYKLDDSPIPSITPNEESSIAASLTLGAVLGCAVSAILSNKIGRKLTMLATIIPAIIGWLIIIYATKTWHLCLSRFVSGFAVSTGFVTTPMYLSEISPPKIRGALLTGVQISSKAGILIEYTIGSFVPIKSCALISMIFPILFGITLIFVPESPYYLLRWGQRGYAEKSLMKLRGKKNVNDELCFIENSVIADLKNKGGFKEIIKTQGNRKALIISLMLILIQQFTGAQAVIAYVQEILHEGKTPINEKYLVIIFGGVTVISTIACCFLVDKTGRRPLLLISSITCCLSMSLLSIYFYLKHNNIIIINNNTIIGWIPTIGVMTFAVSFAIGLAPLPIAICGECFPLKVKELGCGISIVLFMCGSTFITKTYKIIEIEIGLYGAFMMYAICSFFGALYIFFFIPETKGKTLQQIQIDLNTKK
ncbi:hypothetical protein HCN44_001170 [Aphidius gifuensis]|uniref:Major facilitator superfamily (MFS) profile domain-containing protein n=1 Tax=Aphidius gifuensis TaxID=684658 RepID=A0A834XN67_APHGI|nr:hypothetical protein HCN44_001170 [Aphidius gifuensis]